MEEQMRRRRVIASLIVTAILFVLLAASLSVLSIIFLDEPPSVLIILSILGAALMGTAAFYSGFKDTYDLIIHLAEEFVWGSNTRQESDDPEEKTLPDEGTTPEQYITAISILQSQEGALGSERFSRLFTGRDEELLIFTSALSQQITDWRILGISGVGGVGKTWLLQKFNSICQKDRIPASSIIDLSRTRTPATTLSTIVDGLQASGLEFPRFYDTLRKYEKIVQKTHTNVAIWSDIGDLLARTSGYRRSSVDSVLGGFLETEELFLYQRIDTELQKAFISDFTSAANHRDTVVFFFDAYEQIGALEKWLVSFLNLVSPLALTVIVGRRDLGDAWRSLNTEIKRLKLEELRADETSRCISQYQDEYLGDRISPRVLEDLAQFAEGLPLAISWSIDLMARYGISEFAPIQHEVISKLADTLTRKASPEFKAALEVCARLRWVNEDALEFILGNEYNASLIYSELKEVPYSQVTSMGLILHDRIREVLLKDLKQRAPARYKQIAVKSLSWFSKELSRLTKNGFRFSNRWMLIAQEHAHCAFDAQDEQKWQIFRSYFMEGAGRAQIIFCSDLISIIPSNETIWANYYKGRLAAFEGDYDTVVELLEPMADELDDNLLKAYVFDALGPAYYYQGRYQELIDINLQALEISNKFDPGLIPDNLDGIGWGYLRLDKLQLAIDAFSKGLSHAEKNNDIYWKIKHNYNLAAAKAEANEFSEAMTHCEVALGLLGTREPENDLAASILMLQMLVLKKYGDSADAEDLFNKTTEYFSKAGREDKQALSIASIGWILIEKGEYAEALTQLEEGLRLAKLHGHKYYELLNLRGILTLANRTDSDILVAEYGPRALELAKELGNKRLLDGVANLVKEIDGATDTDQL